MKKIGIIFLLSVLLCTLSCSPEEKAPSGGSSTAQTVETQEGAPVTEKGEGSGEAPKDETVPEGAALQDFIDMEAWDFIGQGLDHVGSVGESDSIEALQTRLIQSSEMMEKARLAFMDAREQEGLSRYAEYPIRIIDIYNNAAAEFSSGDGDPGALSSLKKANELLDELLVELEEASDE